MNAARENILARLRAAQEKRGVIGEKIPDYTSPIYHQLDDSLAKEFKTNLEIIGGNVILCETITEAGFEIKRICSELKQNDVFCANPEWIELFDGAFNIQSGEEHFLNLNIAVTGCEFLVAHLGSVLISSAQISGRRLNVFPETHIVIARHKQLTGYLEEALEKIRLKYKNELPSLISNITGPSRTADIEKTLVMGMHGPKSLFVIIVK